MAPTLGGPGSSVSLSPTVPQKACEAIVAAPERLSPQRVWRCQEPCPGSSPKGTLDKPDAQSAHGAALALTSELPVRCNAGSRSADAMRGSVLLALLNQQMTEMTERVEQMLVDVRRAHERLDAHENQLTSTGKALEMYEERCSQFSESLKIAELDQRQCPINASAQCEEVSQQVLWIQSTVHQLCTRVIAKEQQVEDLAAQTLQALEIARVLDGFREELALLKASELVTQQALSDAIEPLRREVANILKSAPPLARESKESEAQDIVTRKEFADAIALARDEVMILGNRMSHHSKDIVRRQEFADITDSMRRGMLQLSDKMQASAGNNLVTRAELDAMQHVDRKALDDLRNWMVQVLLSGKVDVDGQLVDVSVPNSAFLGSSSEQGRLASTAASTSCLDLSEDMNVLLSSAVMTDLSVPHRDLEKTCAEIFDQLWRRHLDIVKNDFGDLWHDIHSELAALSGQMGSVAAAKVGGSLRPPGS